MSGDDLIVRAVALDDIAIRNDGSGRTVVAYAAVFDVEAEIVDGQGHYLERNAPGAFDRTLDRIRPQGGRSAWRAMCVFNHGMTILGSPSPYGTLGAPVEIRADDRGLLTTTRFNRTSHADEVLDMIRNGDIGGFSYRGRIYRSDKQMPTRGWRPRKDGTLEVVTRTELGLVDYGPTPIPAFADAVVVGMRAGTPEGDPPDATEPPDSHDPPQGHSSHSGRLAAVRMAAIHPRIRDILEDQR